MNPTYLAIIACIVTVFVTTHAFPSYASTESDGNDRDVDEPQKISYRWRRSAWPQHHGQQGPQIHHNSPYGGRRDSFGAHHAPPPPPHHGGQSQSHHGFNNRGNQRGK